jgi:hypothetical protein
MQKYLNFNRICICASISSNFPHVPSSHQIAPQGLLQRLPRRLASLQLLQALLRRAQLVWPQLGSCRGVQGVLCAKLGVFLDTLGASWRRWE